MKAQELLCQQASQKEALAHTERELAAIQRACNHKWVLRYDPIVSEGYQDPGDPPGTMGVDRRLPCYINGSTTPRWIRTCSDCGTTQETFRKKTVSEAGEPGCSCYKEVPVFGE